jgi:hypothetical protein
MLVVTFVGCLVGFTAIFLGVSALLQPLIYNSTADKLPLRAIVAALAISILVTGWTFLNTRASHKDKYGTLFEFSATAVRDVEEFQAVRRLNLKDDKGQLKETTVTYKWQTGGGANGGDFLDAENQKPFVRSTSGYIVPALTIKDASGTAKKYVTPTEGTKYTSLKTANENLIYTEEGGSSFVSDQNLRKLETPSPMGAILVIGLNIFLFVAFTICFWPVMRFHLGHSLIMVALFGGVTMFILMPLLFNANKVKVAQVG